MPYHQIVTFTAIVFLAGCPSLLAQHQRRDLSGTIFDKHHEPLRGAIVQAQNLSTQRVVSYVTDRNGQYSFKRLDGDCDYKISVAWHNEHAWHKNLSLFDSNSAKIINFTITTQ